MKNDDKDTPEARVLLARIEMSFPSPAGAIEVLRGVSLEMAPGDSVAIVGPSGSGKSSLLNIMGALDTPTAGVVTIDGIDPAKLEGDDLAAFRRKAVGFVFQEHHLLPQLTALENVVLPCLAAETTEGARERATALLETMGLAARAHAYPATLSGGERQRVAVARALMNDPGTLLCDEPTGSLDNASAIVVSDLLHSLCREKSLCLVVVTHDEKLAASFARTYALTDGVLTPLGADGPGR